ncbi:hypothetical protein [Micromonospora sp. NPDC048839]|uniref:hypothetical protein n=1 Tax=Micromonospora sp. NPDC048839 TaxID=3155641 RepID=UPI0033F8AE25
MTLTLSKPSQLGNTEKVPEFDVPRDGWKRPLVVPIDGGRPAAHTRVTTYIDCIDDKSNLDVYHQRMVLLGAAKKPSLLDAVRLLDPEDAKDKRQLNAIAERAQEIAGANDKREKGSHLHHLSEFVDRGEPLPPCSEADLVDMAAYKMATVQLDVVHIEKLVVVGENKTAGTPDRVSYYDGPGPLVDGKRIHIKGNLITDLKTGSVEYGAFKMAMQLSDYSKGMFYDPTKFPVDMEDAKAFARWKKTEFPEELARAAYTPLPDVNQDWGLIIHLPAGSGVATVYWIDLRAGWEGVLAAKVVRALRRQNKVLHPFEPTVSLDTGPEVASN